MSQNILAYGICLYRKSSSTIEILLCKSISSRNRWGFLKGVQQGSESTTKTAIREFYEESGILVKETFLQKLYYQENSDKNIGIYLVNYDDIDNIEQFFIGNHLKNQYICKENSQVRFFELSIIPEIKKKQSMLYKQIIKDLTY